MSDMAVLKIRQEAFYAGYRLGIRRGTPTQEDFKEYVQRCEVQAEEDKVWEDFASGNP
jgi:hypothetical protein